MLSRSLALCVHGKVELYHGIADRYSTVRVCINGTWYKVCGRGNAVVNSELARVVCHQAGYSPYGESLNINTHTLLISIRQKISQYLSLELYVVLFVKMYAK